MKRTIISTMCVAAALVLASSCNKVEEIFDPGDNTNTEENLGRTIINGVVESIGTKAELSYGYDVLWNTGDKIYVTTGTKDDTFTLSAGEGTTKGKFTEDNSRGITGNIEAFYPASLKTDDGYVWPAVQTNDQVSPMYAKQSISGTGNEVVSFSSLGAMIQIVFSTKSENITITSITLQDESKPLSGKFIVEDGQAIIMTNNENPGVELEFGGDGVPVGVSATYFNLAIPAGKYKGDKITLIFRDDIHSKECVMTSTAFPDVKRNTVGKITLSAEFPVTSVNGHECVKLAGYYWATENVGECGINTPANPSTPQNEYGLYLYKQDNNQALTAAMSWGSEGSYQWTLPTEEQWNDLMNKCYWKWTDSYSDNNSIYFGKPGFMVYGDTGRSDVDNPITVPHIFLPLTGYYDGANKMVIGQDQYGEYWALTKETNLWFWSTFSTMKFFHHDYGFYSLAVRPVIRPEGSYTITFNANGHGTAPASITGIKYGTTITAPTNPAALGYQFKGWYKEAECNNAWNFGTDLVTTNITLFAKWEYVVDIPNKFSVAVGKQVYFSRGNLYWDGNSFEFEDDQFSSASDWNSNHVSHFYWSNDASKAYAEDYSDPAASQNDVFFTNATYTTPNSSFTVNGETGMWRTLSKDEWNYLTTNNSVWATINGINGLIIFYDGYTGSKTGLTTVPNGCVFLPAAGYRNGYSGMISDAGSTGAYSSSIAGFVDGDSTPCAYDMMFGEAYTNPQTLNYRVRYGSSVRLVMDCE